MLRLLAAVVHFGLSDARRINYVSSMSSASLHRSPQRPGTVDITGYVDPETNPKLEGYKCCCDKYKSWRDTARGAHHVKHCIVVKTEKCGADGIAAQISGTTMVAHSHDEVKDGKCEILRASLPAFSNFAGRFIADPGDTVDITQYVDASNQKFEGYKCCCDKRLKEEASGANHVGFCIFVQTESCGDDGIALRISDISTVAHSFEATDGKCEILRTSLPAFSKLSGKYVAANSMLETSQQQQLALTKPDTVDITNYFDPERADFKPNSKLEGYKCCCDKYKSIKDTWRGAEHVGFCVVVKTEKCGGDAIAKLISDTTMVAHSYEETDKKCEILQASLPAFSKITGNFVAANSMLETSQQQQLALTKPDTVDITNYFDPERADFKPNSKLEGYKCCCDKYKSIKDTWRGAEHVGFCVVVKTEKCGGDAIAKLISDTTMVAHSYEETDKKCEILQASLPAFSKITGNFVAANSMPDK